MNRTLILLPLFFWLSALGAQSYSDSIQTLSGAASGNSQAEYAATLARLEPLAEKGVRNADLYYDLGVCYYHLGDRGKAVLNFLRTLNIDSAHKQARENLNYIHTTDPDLPREPRQPYLAQLFLRIYNFFSLNRLALMVLVCALLTTLSLHLLFHYPLDKERGLPVLLVLISSILLLGSGGTLLVKHHRWLHNSRAVVLEAVELRAAPASGRMLKDLPPASTVTVKQASGQQFQVILPDGLSGWIDRQAVEMVVPGQKF
ncbi:MAG: hypothetical protein PHD87_02070 [Candidatus Cloacimonetes bacterium]|nr:hypothetical protein [Candidatus Cloacimonadota bacterium]